MPITINGNGTISGISVGGLPDGSVDRDTLAAAAKGSILQVVQSVKTDNQDGTAAGGTFADITGTDQAGSGSVWCCKITPSSASNKVLVQVTIQAGSANWCMYYKLLRDSTALGLGNDLGGSRSQGTFTGAYPNHADGTSTGSYTYLDSPSSTSELTYKIQASNRSDQAWKINRAHGNPDANYIWSVSSTITLMEIAG